MPIIKALHHAQISLPIGAEEAGRAFYCGVLGLTECEKPEPLRARGGFWLQVGGFQVHVGTENDVERRKTKAHLAYLVDNLDDWREKLERRGVEILEGVSIPNYNRFEFRDPFGNRAAAHHSSWETGEPMQSGSESD